jgi:signal transduction histidine kinase
VTAHGTTTGGDPALAVTRPERRLGFAAWLVLLSGLALLLLSATQSVYRLTLPTDGWSFTSGAIGGPLEDHIIYTANEIGEPSPLQPGDRVLAVEGHAFETLLAHAATREPPMVTGWRAGSTMRYLVQRGETAVALDVPLYRWRSTDLVRFTLGEPLLLVALVSGALGLFVLLRRPNELAARVLFMLTSVWLAAQLSEIVSWGLPELLNPPLWLVAVLFSNWIYGGLFAPTLLLLTLTFPQPKVFVLRRPGVLAVGLYSALPLAAVLFGPQPVLGWAWTVTCALLSLISVLHTMFTASDAVSRAQVRWAGLGVAAVALNFLLEATAGFGLYPASVQGVLPLLAPLLLLLFPLTLAVAILRYRLFAIDLILSRALVYALLTLCVVGIYIGVVTYLGALLRSEDSLLASLVATGIVAVVFQPLRLRLQRGVERLLFGQRSEPYTVIATLGRQLDTARAPDAVFGAIVATIGQSLKLPYVAILSPDETELQAVFPGGAAQPSHLPAQLLRLPLRHQEQVVGVLQVAPRAGEGQITAAEQQLLSDLARQTSIAVYAARLSADVQQSRERIVLAREEERRRLRRDLHDGLGPQLASQALTLDVIARMVRNDPDGAAALLQTVREQIQAAVGEIRELIYGLRPPVLDDVGLHGAIAELVERVRLQHSQPHVRLDLPDEQIPLPAAVEVASYRIVQEALTNVVRHARASHCVLRLIYRGADGASAHLHTANASQLVLEIQDDGVGIATNRLSGVGLQSMRERAEELGGQLVLASGAGGTTLRAVLPLGSEGG